MSASQSTSRRLRHELPTHLDVRDRVLLGLSARQTMLLMSGLAFAYGIWGHLAVYAVLPLACRLGVTALLLLLTAGAVFIRPHGRGLEVWAFVVLRYTTLARRAVWRPAPVRREGVRRAPAPDQWSELDSTVWAASSQRGTVSPQEPSTEACS